MTSHTPLDLKSTLARLPPAPPSDLRQHIQTLLKDSSAKILILVALDDDPTGTQTCHDVVVLSSILLYFSFT